MKAWSIQIWFRSQTFVFLCRKVVFFQQQMKGCAHTSLLDLFLPTCPSITSFPLTASFPFLPPPALVFFPWHFYFPGLPLSALPRVLISLHTHTIFRHSSGISINLWGKKCNIITIYYTCLINFLLNYGMTWTSAEETYPLAAEGPEVLWFGGEVRATRHVENDIAEPSVPAWPHVLHDLSFITSILQAILSLQLLLWILGLFILHLLAYIPLIHLCFAPILSSRCVYWCHGHSVERVACIYVRF